MITWCIFSDSQHLASISCHSRFTIQNIPRHLPPATSAVGACPRDCPARAGHAALVPRLSRYPDASLPKLCICLVIHSLDSHRSRSRSAQRARQNRLSSQSQSTTAVSSLPVHPPFVLVIGVRFRFKHRTGLLIWTTSATAI